MISVLCLARMYHKFTSSSQLVSRALDTIDPKFQTHLLVNFDVLNLHRPSLAHSGTA